MESGADPLPGADGSKAESGRITCRGADALSDGSGWETAVEYCKGYTMHERRPQGWSTITPRLVTRDVGGLVTFLKAAFDAQGELLSGRPTELRIGDSMLMVSDGGGVRSAMPAFLHLYVSDADALYARAIAAGAQTIEPPSDMPYGDRRAMVSDAWGNLWQIATFNGAKVR